MPPPASHPARVPPPFPRHQERPRRRRKKAKAKCQKTLIPFCPGKLEVKNTHSRATKVGRKAFVGEKLGGAMDTIEASSSWLAELRRQDASWPSCPSTAARSGC